MQLKSALNGSNYSITDVDRNEKRTKISSVKVACRGPFIVTCWMSIWR